MRNTKAGRYIENHVKEGAIEKYLPEIKKEWKKNLMRKDAGFISKETVEKEAIKNAEGK